MIHVPGKQPLLLISNQLILPLKKTSNPVAFQKKMVEFPRFFPGPWDFLLAMCLLVSKLRNFHGLGPGRSTREGAVVLPSGAIS